MKTCKWNGRRTLTQNCTYHSDSFLAGETAQFSDSEEKMMHGRPDDGAIAETREVSVEWSVYDFHQGCREFRNAFFFFFFEGSVFCSFFGGIFLYATILTGLLSVQLKIKITVKRELQFKMTNFNLPDLLSHSMSSLSLPSFSILLPPHAPLLLSVAGPFSCVDSGSPFCFLNEWMNEWGGILIVLSMG